MINLNSVRMKQKVNLAIKGLLLIATTVSASLIILIVFFIVRTGVLPFFDAERYAGQSVRLVPFLTGMRWFTPPNHYGIGFVIINTIYIVFLSIIIAVPIAIFTAVYVSKFAPKMISHFLQSIIELLAAIPSIVYGVFGAGFIATQVRQLASAFGTQTAGGISVLTTVLVLALMILPTITLMTMTALQAVSKELESASQALGATKTQTIFNVSLQAAKSGIFAGIILGVGRALGEATAVSMVAGNAATGPNFSMFEPTRTLTSTMLLGLKETVGLDYDVRFSVGIVLIVTIVFTNLTLNFVKRKIGNTYV